MTCAESFVRPMKCKSGTTRCVDSALHAVAAERSHMKISEIDKVNEFEDIDCRHAEGRQGLEMAGLLE